MIQPLHEYVIVRPYDPPETATGILIPAMYRADTSNRSDFIPESNRFCAGTVVRIGKGKKVSADRREVPDLEIGSKVFYKRAEAIELPGEAEFVIVRDDSIAFEYVEKTAP